MQEFNDGFTKSRICVGQQETDNFDQSLKSSDLPLGDRKDSPIHMTVEHVDPIVGMRFCRTYFLSALAADGANYMKNV